MSWRASTVLVEEEEFPAQPCIKFAYPPARAARIPIVDGTKISKFGVCQSGDFLCQNIGWNLSQSSERHYHLSDPPPQSRFKLAWCLVPFSNF